MQFAELSITIEFLVKKLSYSSFVLTTEISVKQVNDKTMKISARIVAFLQSVNWTNFLISVNIKKPTKY